MPQRRLLAALLAASLIVGAGILRADVGPGLYVSEAGEDVGACTDVRAPCRTIPYALQVAEKNTRIHVAVGSYEFGDPEAIIYAMSGAVHVHGGYVEDDQGQWIKGGVAFLTSVPPDYREFFRKHGFVAIADAKGDQRDPQAAAQFLAQHQRVQRSTAASDCVGGMADGFACSGIDLLSHTARVDFSSSPMAVADIWGFVDLNTRREYVLVGVYNGTAVFDVTDSGNPLEVGFVGGQNATWRDVKILQFFDDLSSRWRAYAYVTTDGASDGLVVIDLGGLPHSISQVPYASDFLNAHNVYITDTDYATGIVNHAASPQLIIAGSGLDSGQFRTYSLDDPASPVFLQRQSNAGYMHDATSMRIDDARTDQCGGSPASCNVLVDFNEEHVEVWDVTAASSPALLARMPEYANRGYVHSGWWTEDRHYVLVHDELDEQDRGLPTTVRVVSFADLTDPVVVGQWNGSIPSIDHNGFVRGNRYYMSNYTAGLTILDLANPTAPVAAGFFDTYPVSNSTIFAGAWGAYPYLPSGAVAVSDINSGLYLLRDGTRDVAQGSLGFGARSYGLSEGQSTAIRVTRSSGTSGAVSVDYELLAVSGEAADVMIGGVSLDWADGDASDRIVQIDAIADAAIEGLEEIWLRLVNPQGGATLDSNDATTLFIADAGSAPALAFDREAVDVAEQGFGRAILTVRRIGNASGPVSVEFEVAGGDAVAGTDFSGATSGTLSWADGDALPRAIEFDIADDGDPESNEFFEVSLANALGGNVSGAASATVIIRDGAGLNSPPEVSAGAAQTRSAGTNVMLNGSATFDPDGDELTYAWTQESGPGVALNGTDTDTATFAAPQVNSSSTLQFRLTATDARGASASATTTVTVVPATTPAGGDSGGSSGSSGPLVLILLSACATLRIRRRSRHGSGASSDRF